MRGRRGEGGEGKGWRRQGGREGVGLGRVRGEKGEGRGGGRREGGKGNVRCVEGGEREREGGMRRGIG